MGFISGSPSKQTSSSTSNSSSQSGNQAYGLLSNALAPTLGYGAQAGNMMAALLGIPSSSPTPPAPVSTGGTAPIPNPTPSYGGNPYQGIPSDGGGMFPGSPVNGLNLPNDPANSQFYSEANGAGAFNLKPTRADLRAGGALQGPRQAQAIGQPGTEQPQPLAAAPNPITGQVAGSALDNFANSAGMDFMRDQGVKAIEASQAGKGMLQSGATGQALTSFGQNLSKTYLNDYLSHLMDYAGLGTKNAAVLAGSGGTSSSTGMSSGTGSGTGPKNGLVQDVSSLLGAAGGGSGLAAMGLV